MEYQPYMNREPEFEMYQGYAVIRPTGEVSFNAAVEFVSRSLVSARSRQVRNLLVDTTRLSGFPSPDTVQRFFMAVEWAAVSNGVRLAVVARAELIDHERFGVTVARNRGLHSNVFSSETEAIEWLLHPAPP